MVGEGQEALKRKNALAQGKKLFTCTWPNCGAPPAPSARDGRRRRRAAYVSRTG